MMLRILSLVLMGMFAVSYPCEAQQAPRINCTAPYQRELELAPLVSGPLHLRAVYCQRIRSMPFPRGVPMLSPDGQSIAYLENDAILRIAQLGDSDRWIDYPTEMGAFAGFGRSIRSLPSVSWASNSKSVWAANHDTLLPSRSAKSPLQPLKTAGDGSILTLPPLQHEAGPLDGLLWADGDGLAVAQFGTRASYYRPEHPDPNPSFAIVDAQRGLVRDTLAFATIEALKDRAKGLAPHAAIKNAAATRLPNGKVRALLDVGQWVVWTEGQPAITMANPYATDFDGYIVMSPDGSHFLVGRLLRTEGAVICEHRPNCGTAGRPVEGVLAALHDLEDGRLLWSIRATVTADYEFPAPAISPDARFALIGLAPEGARPLIALVAMEDGKIVQTIPSPGGSYAMGFSRGGLSVWTHAHGLTALYDVQPNRQQ
jgi:hypothetical protein